MSPTPYDVTIFIDGYNVTEYCPYELMSFEDLRVNVSTFKLTLQNPPFTPTRDMRMQVIANSLPDLPSIFVGYLIECTETKHGNGITKDYEIEAADRKIRLQKSVVPPLDYTGIDTDILDDLLADTYPDLSDIYDFSTDVDNIADDLGLSVNDDSLLDAINGLADQAGANVRYEPGDQTNEEVTITFEPDVDTIPFNGASSDGDIPFYWSDEGTPQDTYGNGGGYAFRETGVTPAAPSARLVEFILHVANENAVNFETLSFDYYLDCPLDTTTHTVNCRVISIGGSAIAFGAVGLNDAAWHTFTASGSGLGTWNQNNPGYAIEIRIRFEAPLNSPYEARIDNVVFTTDKPVAQGTGKDKLGWKGAPEANDFDLDIDSSDEFAFDIDLTTGGFDFYNSIIVTGGSTQEAIDWTYLSRGYQDHFKLELPVQDLVVYKNTGSDASPTWTLQTLGTWGVDDIGTKDVLYDPTFQWLYFNTDPGDFGRAFRITGTVAKPLRVRVENVAPGENVYVTTIYDENVTSVEEATILGFSELNKRNLIKYLKFRTYEPGIKVGRTIHVTDTNRDLDENPIVQRVYTRWLGASGHAEFEIEAGNTDDGGIDTIAANADWRSREKAVPIPAVTVGFAALLDSDGEPLEDSDGQLLYQQE
jgi:hypothetical protein